MTRPETVVLKGYPVALGIALTEHVYDWMREFRLIALSGGGQAPSSVPEQLQQMVDAITSTYAGELSEPEQRLAEAAARGDETVDLEYPVREETEQVVLGWDAMTAAVDAFCRSEDLLTLQRTPQMVALQDWVSGEFLRQVAGKPPRPWASPRG